MARPVYECEEFNQEPEIHREEPSNKGCEGGGGDAVIPSALSALVAGQTPELVKPKKHRETRARKTGGGGGGDKKRGERGRLPV